MALDPRLQKQLRQRQDDIMRQTIGDEAFEKFKVRRHLNAVCYKCPHVQHDGDTLDVCDPPNDFHCMRQQEKDLIEEGLVIPE